jgi:Nif-specific regulatory protein
VENEVLSRRSVLSTECFSHLSCRRCASGKTDILLLADYFLEKYAAENGKGHPAVFHARHRHADRLITGPGNVRELKTASNGLCCCAKKGSFTAINLPPTLQTGPESGTIPTHSLEEAVSKLEKEMLIDALKNTRGNVSQAADMLKTTVRKFAYKAKRYGVDYRDYR